MGIALILVIILLVLSVVSQVMGRGESVLLTLWAIAVILLCNVHI
jgi:hypothetical protein